MTPDETVTALVTACEARDLDAVCALVTDDIEYDNVPIGKNIGPDAMRAFLGVMAGNVDEVQFVIHRQTVTGNVVMNERTDRFRVGDAWMDLKVAGIFEVNDAGQVTLWRDYFDMGEFNEQMQKLAG